MTVSLLQVQDLVKSFPSRHGTHPVRAVDGVSFTLRGEKHSVSSVNPGVENPLWQGWC